MRQADTPELADFLAMNLLRHLPYAPALAIKAIADEAVSCKRAGYALTGRLFSDGQPLGGGDLSAYIRAATADLASENSGVAGYVVSSLRHAVRGTDTAPAILAAFAPDSPIGSELQLEYDYYRRSFSDM